MKILVIEDDKVIGRNLVSLLEDAGYTVEYFSTGKEGLGAGSVNEYDCILLDWMLPDLDGDEVCRQLRDKDIRTPIIFLTARNQLEDKVNGLDLGADDYITKPFVIEELLARLRTVIRRNYNNDLQSVIQLGELEIDTSRASILLNGKPVELTPKEYSLLEYLAMHKGEVVSRGEMIEHIWDNNADLFSNVVDVHIKNIRKALESRKNSFELKTIKGKGYMLCLK